MPADPGVGPALDAAPGPERPLERGRGPVMPGAEPFAAAGVAPSCGGALVLHGFTGSPHSVRGVARALADAGMAVEAPLLPGHGTTPDDMVATTWDDWRAAAEASWADLDARCDAVVVVGLSMGGTLAAALAADHPEIAGIVAVNPYIDPPAASFQDLLRGVLAAGETWVPGIGSDIARPGASEVGYSGTPVEPLLSLCHALDRLHPRLEAIACPVLLMTSRVDHVVPPVSSDVLAAAVTGPVERVWLEHSYHAATLDTDGDEIERRTVAFATKVVGARLRSAG
ncbi:MAG: alpha/beta hydrolase [Acidimicrobiales bacterium]